MARQSDLKNKLIFTIYPPIGGPETITFNGYIDILSDSNNPGWSQVNDMGRPDSVKTYSQYGRSANVAFTVVALNSGEHTENYTKMNVLAKASYPYFQAGQGYNGHFIKLTVANYFKCYGVLSSLTYDWDSDTPWIDSKPLITRVNLTIDVTADYNGKRPTQNYKHFSP